LVFLKGFGIAVFGADMLQFLGNDDIWRELRAISRHRKCPLYVAVPFLGNAGGKLLYLKRGDVLVVALTLANSRNGSVCPAEIERLQAKGVRVFLAPYLHAKVLLCGRKAVVGSANLSQTSFAHLDEAAMLTTDANVVKHIRAWFQQRMLEPVSPEWLKVCGKAYRPPRGGIRRKGTKRTMHPVGAGVWFLSLRPVIHPEDEAAIAERGEAEARRELSDAAKFKVNRLRWTGSPSFLTRIRKGDTVIQIMQTADSHYVEELARFIGMRKTKSQRGAAVTYLYLECRRRPKRMRWIDFKRRCLSVGLRVRLATRQVSNPAQAAKVLVFVSRNAS
jgi:hypothetical protein